MVFSLILLVLVNLIPFVGIKFYNWDIFSIIFLYWSENFIIGFYNVLKMRKLTGSLLHKDIRFFIMHYGLFTAIHGACVIFLLNADPQTGRVELERIGWTALLGSLVLPWISLFISHGLSFYQHYLQNKEYERTSVSNLLFAPYGRIFIMQFVIIGGALLIKRFEYAGFVYILVALKIIMDLLRHFLSHTAKTSPKTKPMLS